MDIEFHPSDDRRLFEHALAWAVEDTGSSDAFRHAPEVIQGRAAQKVDDAIALLRETVEREVVAVLKALLPVHVSPMHIAYVATFLALEELEGWDERHRTELVEDIVTTLLVSAADDILDHARYRF